MACVQHLSRHQQPLQVEAGAWLLHNQLHQLEACLRSGKQTVRVKRLVVTNEQMTQSEPGEQSSMKSGLQTRPKYCPQDDVEVTYKYDGIAKDDSLAHNPSPNWLTSLSFSMQETDAKCYSNTSARVEQNGTWWPVYNPASLHSLGHPN